MATFIFGGDTNETPESIKRKRAIAQALLVANGAPRNIGEGLNALGDGIVSAVMNSRADKAEKAGTDSATAAFAPIADMLSGGSGGSGSQVPMTGASAEVSASDPGDYTGNQVFGDFMDTVKGTVKNPFALAAIAATGKAESGFSPGNVGRTWSDPSESGQPGTAGGIMSWRGPRYEALRATGDLSPTGQAKFFLNEDPNLIASLNNAKSVDEAQALMNKAWAFRGYDRPGGEAGRRLGYAKGFLPSFQTNGTTEVASLDPKAGMTTEAAPQVAATSPAPQTAAAPPVPSPAPARGPAVAQALIAGSTPQRPRRDTSAIYRALSNPWLSPGQRSIAEALLQQETARDNAIMENELKQADPKYQLDLQKGKIELDNLQNPKISPADQQRIDLDKSKFDFEKNKPTEVGGRLIAPDGKVIYEAPGKWQKLDDGSLFNEVTGEFRTAPKPEGQSGFRFKGTSVEAQSLNGLIDSGALTEDQAQQLGAGKTVSGPNGEIIFMTPQGVFAGDPKAGTAKPMQIPQQAQPDTVDLFGDGGAPAPVQAPAPVAPAPAVQPQPEAAPQRQGMIPLTEPKVTIDESKAAGFADRMTQAEDILNKFGAAGGNVKDQFVSDNEYIPDFAENWLMSNDFQNFAQARRNFINAQLRRESGAVIGPDEFANARKQYFPEPNDNAEVLKQKAQNRKTAIDAMIRDAGPTYGKKKPSKDIGDMPDFSKMSDEELQRYIDGK